MTLPSRLIEVFGLDEGMRPSIYFDRLSSDEVIGIYNYVKNHSKEVESECTVWSNKLEKDLPINSFENPAYLVTVGEICQFCHPIIDFTNNNIFVNNVSIYVFPDSLEIFYDVRDINSKGEINSILILIKEIAAMCSNCTPFFGGECGEPREEVYQIELRAYLNA